MKFEFAGEKPEGYFVKAPEYKAIKGAYGYMVGRDGSILRLPRLRYAKNRKSSLVGFRRHFGADGNYKRTCIKINGKDKMFLVHRLVADAFVANPKNRPEINHIDGNKYNNDFRNLEFVNRKENMAHAYAVGLVNEHMTFERAKSLRIIPEKSNIHIKNIKWAKNCRKLNDEQVRYIRSQCDNRSFASMARELGIAEPTVMRCFKGLTYQDIE